MFHQIQNLALLTITLTLITTNTCFALECITLKATLPTRGHFASAIYDEAAAEDLIFILGHNLNDPSQIYSFNISSELVALAGSSLNQSYGVGIWVDGASGEFLHLGGTNAYDNSASDSIYKIGLANIDNATLVNHLPVGASFPSVFSDSANNSLNGDVYIVGGHGDAGSLNSITRFNKQSNEVQIVARLPSSRHATVSLWDSNNDAAYIFGGQSGEYIAMNEILKYEPSTGNVTTLNVTLPTLTSIPCGVWTGNEGYIFGGDSEFGYPIPGVIRFNPNGNQVEELTIQNFPRYIYGTSCVYVKKLNRVYFFGGVINQDSSNAIMYVDLSN